MCQLRTLATQMPSDVLGAGELMGAIRDSPVSAVFVSHEGHLAEGGAGVQICTREYFETLQAAGLHLRPVEIPTDRRLMTRLSRRLRPRAYEKLLDLDDTVTRISKVLPEETRFIFLNQRSLAAAAMRLRAIIPRHCRVVLLSHGLESVDYLHGLRTRRLLGVREPKNSQVGFLGHLLLVETRQSEFIDHVFCLSPFEASIEQWLGARRVTYLPRAILPQRLDWAPRYGRLGFVGTLDHPPNAEGLLLFLMALERMAFREIRVRVVGAPRNIGTALADRFRIVDYLGPLSNTELENEACTWNCLVHPLFCYARGVSTKLAIALGWQIPIVTTTPGCRGYTWREGQLPLAEDPESVARLAITMVQPALADAARREVVKAAQSSPRVADVAAIARAALGLACERP